MKFSAVILAGGKSTRMGRDKAFLEIHGEILLARQIRIAREAGAAEVFVSGRAGVDYSAFGCRVLEDKIQDAGPMAGVVAGLVAANFLLVLVLAVDMPQMSAEFLKRLLAYCSEASGAIPRVDGELQPLAACYPKFTMKLSPFDMTVRWKSKGGRPVGGPSARAFAEACRKQGVVRLVDFPAADAHFFINWNQPVDLAVRK